MPNLRENRKTKRRHLIYYLRVFNQQNNELLGHLADITSEGLMLIGEHALPVGEAYMLHMKLPAEILGKETMDFNATALWSRPDVDPAFFATGFRIQDIADEDIKIIRRLIKDFGFQD